MKLIIGSDKGGFAVKEAIAEYLRETGIDFEDIGTKDVNNPMSHVEVASTAGELISNGKADRGILVCGTGMGMAITANKFKGVYAALVESQYAAVYARKINDANVLCLGGFIVGPAMAKEIADSFLHTEFLEKFPQWRIDYLTGQMQALKAVEDRVYG